MKPLKRDPRLRKLSWDHHRTLALALRGQRAIGTGKQDRMAAVWEEILHRIPVELEPHFQVEERLLLPAMKEAGETNLVDRTLTDHSSLRSLFGQSGGTVENRLKSFTTLIKDHIRFEERTLFEVAQEILDGSILDDIAEATR